MGKLTKMQIVSFNKNDYSGKSGEMNVQFNPNSLKVSWNGKPKGNQIKKIMASGKTKDVKMVDLGSSTITMDLVFDDTLSKIGKPVSENIEKFKDLCLMTHSEVHAPRYLKISWGDFLFKCQLVSLSITYELFTPDGKPLRGMASCSFKGFQDALSKAREENEKSPDMTRIVMVKEGDNLPLLCYRHYGSNRHYLKVAKVNGLPSASFLRPGQRIVFPPLVDDIAGYYKEEN